MKKLFAISAAASLAFCLLAASRPDATLVVTYDFERCRHDVDSLEYSKDQMVLQLAPTASRFFSAKTEFFDSLHSAPGGAKLIQQMQMDALNSSGGIKRDASGNITSITVDAKAMENVPSRGFLTCVYKDMDKGEMTVYDGIHGPSDVRYTYSLPVDEIAWEPGDSVTTILGYECQNATGEYHGRVWEAWFASDLPLADGPWQLCGLPGLILKATTAGDEYRLTATGVHSAAEPIKDLAGDPEIEKIDRREFLKMLDKNHRDPGAQYGFPMPQEVFHDLIETDYK